MSVVQATIPTVSSYVASFEAEPIAAQRASDLLSEALDPASAVVSAFERQPGQWAVDIHLAEQPNLEALRSLIAEIAGDDAAGTLTVETLSARDWVAASLDGFPPVNAGRFVVHGSHHRGKLLPRGVAIEIEAALAFGTGHHGTTRGCLLALEHTLVGRTARPAPERRALRILDVGTGTGVLAIAAAKALRTPVLASDIDPSAVRIARANAQANAAGAFVTAALASGVTGPAFLRHAPYDLIFANILLHPLKRLAAPLARLTRPGGRVILSGLLHHQANAALAAYRLQGLVLIERIPLDEWTTLVLTHPTVPRAACFSARRAGHPGRGH